MRIATFPFIHYFCSLRFTAARSLPPRAVNYSHDARRPPSHPSIPQILSDNCPLSWIFTGFSQLIAIRETLENVLSYTPASAPFPELPTRWEESYPQAGITL